MKCFPIMEKVISAAQKRLFIILVLLVGGVLLRFIPLNSIFYADDIVVMQVAEQKYFLAPANVNPHPPLGNLMLILSTTLFGIAEWTFRLPAFLFSIATMILVYFFTKHFINEKAALWSLFLISFFGWHIYSAATNIGGDGILAFFLLLASYYFLQHVHEDDLKKQIMIGTLIALASFVKETTLILAPVLLLYMFFSKIAIKAACKKILYMGLGFSIPWLIFISIDLFFNNLQAFQNLINLMLRTGVEKSGYIAPGFFQYLFSFFKVAVWTTPFFLCVVILWWFSKRQKMQQSMHGRNIRLYIKLFLFVFGSFFLFYISPSFDKPRYLLVIVPFLCVVGGDYLSKFSFTRKEQLSLVLVTLLFFSVFFVINQQRNSISFDQKEKIIESIMQLKLDFDVGLISETGNSGFVIKLNVVLIAYALAFLFAFAYLIVRKISVKHQTVFFILFFAVAFAFNLFVAQEYIFHLTAPDYGKVSEQLHNYALINDLKQPIYLFKNPSMAYYLKPKYEEFYAFDVIQNSPERIQQFKELVREKGGTILLVDLPFVNKKGDLWQFITAACEERNVITDKGIKAGYVIACSKK